MSETYLPNFKFVGFIVPDVDTILIRLPFGAGSYSFYSTELGLKCDRDFLSPIGLATPKTIESTLNSVIFDYFYMSPS